MNNIIYIFKKLNKTNSQRMKKEEKNILSKEDLEIWHAYTKNISKKHGNYYGKKIYKKRLRTNFLDLHGKTINESYKTTKDFLIDSKHNNFDHVLIITGKSGIIRKEFVFWLEDFKDKKIIRYYEILNKGGAFKIKF